MTCDGAHARGRRCLFRDRLRFSWFWAYASSALVTHALNSRVRPQMSKGALVFASTIRSTRRQSGGRERHRLNRTVAG